MGIELNNKGKEQKSDEVVSGRMTFLDNPPVYTPPVMPQKYLRIFIIILLYIPGIN